MTTTTKYSRKRKRWNIRTDWISNLPDEILVSIISHLPVHELLATSCLSRRWRSLWTLVPRLDFNLSEEPRPEVILGSVLAGRNNSSRLSVCRIRHINNEEEADLHTWIPYLTLKSISKLILHCRPPFYFDPYQILTIPSLQELYLTGFQFRPHVPPLSGISLVSSLILINVFFSDHCDLNTLIDSAPLLERLTLSYCSFYMGLNSSICIHAQYLKLLEIDRMDFYLLDLEAPVLTKLRLHDLDYLDDVAVAAPSLLFLNTSDTIDEEIENNIADLKQEIEDGLVYQVIEDDLSDQEIEDGLVYQVIEDDLSDQEIEDGLADQEIEPMYNNINNNRKPNLSSSIQILDLFNKVPESPSFLVGLRKLIIGIKPSDSDHYSVLISVLEKCTQLQELGIIIHPDRMFNRFRECMSSGYLPRLRGSIVLKRFHCLEHHLEHLWIKGYTLPVLEVVRLILWKSVALKRLLVSHTDFTSAQVMKTFKFLLPSPSQVNITIKSE